MASGVGSASMMSASLGTLTVMYPEMADQLAAFATLCFPVWTGCIWLCSLALPMTEWLYKKCCIIKYGHVLTKEEEGK